jgi:acetyl esterase/lipase
MRRLLVFALALCLSALSCGFAQEQSPTRVRDVVYGRKGGMLLSMDVLKPAKPSGIGVLWMVSGGWHSSHEAINPGIVKPFLDRGHTVFGIVHGSQPKWVIPEITGDIDRATRYVRAHADDYGVDPQRLGISGASSGGHLSLTQAARGKDGDPNAQDPLLRVSSRVQAVACFFPPTDFLNYGETGTNALEAQVLMRFWPAFGASGREPAQLEKAARAASPIYDVTPAMPPTLIIHGDADKLVPIQQAQLFMERLEKAGVKHKLVVREGQAHGWATLPQDVNLLAAWFDEHCVRK